MGRGGKYAWCCRVLRRGTSADANVNANARCKIRIRLIVTNTVIKECRLGSFEALKDISPL